MADATPVNLWMNDFFSYLTEEAYNEIVNINFKTHYSHELSPSGFTLQIETLSDIFLIELKTVNYISFFRLTHVFVDDNVHCFEKMVSTMTEVTNYINQNLYANEDAIMHFLCKQCQNNYINSMDEVSLKDILQKPENQMWSDGVVLTTMGGYGSEHDEEKFLIPICDECLSKNFNMTEVNTSCFL